MYDGNLGDDWLIYFITSIQEVVTRTLTPFVTSSFKMHSMTVTVTIMSSIIGGLSKLPLAKILDMWGRPQGIAVATVIWFLGFVMVAACKNVAAYAAAQVFSSVGAQGVSYCLTIFIADTSSLVNRPLMLVFATSPYMVTPWIGGPVSDGILAGPGWRWGFGIWAIVAPAVVAPLITIFWNARKAKKAGLVPERKHTITLSKIKSACVDMDLVGLLILAGGMAMFLFQFALFSSQNKQWESPTIICLILFGGLLLIAFAT